MKVINNKFNEMDTPLNIEQTVNYIKNVLEQMDIDNNILSNILMNIDSMYIQVADDNNFSIKLPNGSFKENKISMSVGALKTNMLISIDDKELNITPGIVVKENYNNHQLIHESLHGLSSKQHNFYDENGITYTKTGTKIDYYDKSLNDYENIENLSSEGLNEGITEYLTSMLTNQYTGTYAPFVVISKLFMTSNNSLINAYFMNDISGLERFYEDVEEKQSLINRTDFTNLTSKCTDFDLISKIIAAGINYNKAYGIEMTKEEINNIITYLDNNMTLDTGSWYDLISNYKTTKIY